MTKFEEDLNNKINLKEVPMHFTQSGCSLTRKTYIETNWVFDTYGNWHSDEEFQELKEEYSNQADSILLMLEEIGSLKSQLQQQALPVVPECVAKDVKRLSLSTLADWNVAVSYISKETLEWLSTTGNTNIFLGKSWTLCSLKINGFKVEKPQLFYLKHIDMSKLDEKHDWFILHHGSLGHSPFCKGELPYYCNNAKFTQQEIDSMETGSYEQIEVAE